MVRLLSALAAALLLAPLASAVSTSAARPRTQRCKCTASQACWPSRAQWAQLSAQLSQPLFDVHPVARPCHDPTFDAAACAGVREHFFDGLWRSDQPGASESANWEARDGLTVSCNYNTTRAEPCAQGRVPVLGVNATRPEDVQAAVRFAARNNIRLVVKNTGHDFLGRGFAVGALVIWTHHWKFSNYTENFTPRGAPPSGFPAVTIGPGVQWGELYAFVSTLNKSIAGGIGPQGSVGAAGGWPLGGGHNILSPSLGLGVDNVLQITVVTPSGAHLTANTHQNAELFWALRGGGGPSFGVATSITYRLHADPPLYAYFFQATFDPADFGAVMRSWHGALPRLTDAGWAGYYPFANSFLALMYLLRGGDAAAGNATLGPWLREVAQIPSVRVVTNESLLYPNYFSWFDANILNPVAVIGFNYTSGATMGDSNDPASWLIPRSLFEGEDNLEKLADAFRPMTIGIGQHVGGGVVSQVPGDAMAAHPAWRSALVDVAIAGFWDASATPEAVRAIQQNTSDQMAPLRALTPGPLYAQYLNEPDILVPDWQAANWGANYPRLLALKRRFDPQGLFVVRQGVGSEFWDAEQQCLL